jgi:hypothetical protein
MSPHVLFKLQAAGSRGAPQRKLAALEDLGGRQQSSACVLQADNPSGGYDVFAVMAGFLQDLS